MEILDRAKIYVELPFGNHCGPAFESAIREELVEHCGGAFYNECAFGDIVGPVCPFDPVQLAHEWKLMVTLEELKAQYEELKTQYKEIRALVK